MKLLITQRAIQCVATAAISVASFAALAQTAPGVQPGIASAAPDWQSSVGIGVISVPKYLGSSDQRWLPIPAFDVRYKDFLFINPADGVGVQSRIGNLALSSSIGIDLNSRDPKDSPRLGKLSKVGLAPATRLRAAYEVEQFSASATWVNRLGSTQKRGSLVELEAGYNVLSTDKLVTTAGVASRWHDQKFADNLISISTRDARLSGLPAFNARRGMLDAGVFVQSVYRVNSDWAVFSRLQVNQLRADARLSPIVERKNQAIFSLFVNYQF